MTAKTPNRQEQGRGRQRVRPCTRTTLCRSLDDHLPHCRYYEPTLSRLQAQRQLPCPPDESAKVVRCHLREVTTCLGATPHAKPPQMSAVHRKIPHAKCTTLMVTLGRGLPYQASIAKTDLVRAVSSRRPKHSTDNGRESRYFAERSDGRLHVD